MWLWLLLPWSAARADSWDAPSRLLTGLNDRLERLRFLAADEPSRVVRNHEVTVGTGMARIRFAYAGGGLLDLALDHGQVVVDGRALGGYPANGALETAWRQLLLDLSHRSTPDALDALRAWEPDGLSHGERAYLAALHARLGSLSAPTGLTPLSQDIPEAGPGGLIIPLDDLGNPAAITPLLEQAAALGGNDLRLTVPNGHAHLGDFSVGSAEHRSGHLLVVHGDANVFGTVEGNVATVDGDIVVHPGAVITGDVLAASGVVRDQGGDIRGQITTVALANQHAAPDTGRPAPEPGFGLSLLRRGAGVAGTFLTLLLIGFGLVLFARPPLEVMSDTALHSFGRSFLVGLLGQILVLPTFGALVVGLVLSVAGILLVPFVVIAFALLVVAAVLGGFLAIAHAMGETVTRRQLARGLAISHANSYRYVAVGLASLAALWAAWAVFGRVPVAGGVAFGAATLVTWLLATVGFGASLLSRAGLREHFAGRLIPEEALTDEYLWATPQFGVKAVERPGKTTGGKR